MLLLNDKWRAAQTIYYDDCRNHDSAIHSLEIGFRAMSYKPMTIYVSSIESSKYQAAGDFFPCLGCVREKRYPAQSLRSEFGTEVILE